VNPANTEVRALLSDVAARTAHARIRDGVRAGARVRDFYDLGIALAEANR
jgi:hypothetical protein